MSEPNIGQMVGGAINALPLDSMFTIPGMAMAKTQAALSHQYYEFIQSVGLEDDGNGGKRVVMVSARFEEAILDSEGNKQSTQVREVSVPLMSLMTHPNVNVQEGSVEFEMTIQSTSEQASEVEGEGGFEAKVGWGPFSAKVHGRMSHKSSQTRKTDTRARYAVSMKLAKDAMPEGMSQFLETVMNASMQPHIVDAQSN